MSLTFGSLASRSRSLCIVCPYRGHSTFVRMCPICPHAPHFIFRSFLSLLLSLFLLACGRGGGTVPTPCPLCSSLYSCSCLASLFLSLRLCSCNRLFARFSSCNRSSSSALSNCAVCLTSPPLAFIAFSSEILLSSKMISTRSSFVPSSNVVMIVLLNLRFPLCHFSFLEPAFFSGTSLPSPPCSICLKSWKSASSPSFSSSSWSRSSKSLPRSSASSYVASPGITSPASTFRCLSKASLRSLEYISCCWAMETRLPRAKRFNRSPSFPPS
mmetsp:Transcript_5960/g.36967  ORF Transcript_5960/g.36967 Transcript_5960/m.36967 type:complete len:271 (+) Transcript_5960:2667-3479(+)